MPKLSVIIPTRNSEEHLREALECLITQTDDDFEVIIVDCMSEDSTGAIIDEYCGEYVDFYRVNLDSANRFAAMNRGLELSKCEYVWFYAPDGRVNPNTVEAFLEYIKQFEADAGAGRVWQYGDFDPHYDMHDATATLPKFDKYERSVLWDDEISNKVFRRASLIGKQLRFAENFKYAEGIFNLRAVLSGMKICGCPTAVYQRRSLRGLDGFSEGFEPSLENAKAFIDKMTEVCAICEAEIRKDTGTVDGDEAFLQEAYFVAASTLIDRFYRFFWHLTPETLDFVREHFQKYTGLLISEKMKKLKEKNQDFNIPELFPNHEQAQQTPGFSLLLDITDENEMPELIKSLYVQDFPFFELFVRQTQFDSSFFPEEWKNAPNLRVLPNSGFHALARQQAKSRISINLRDGRPFDRRVLRQVFMSSAPVFMKPIIFAQTKNSFKVKRTLKDKGLGLT